MGDNSVSKVSNPVLPPDVTLRYDASSARVSVHVGTSSFGSIGPLASHLEGHIQGWLNGVDVELRWKGFDTRWFGQPVQIPGAPPNPALAGAQAATS